LQYGLRLSNGDFWTLYFSKDLIPWGKEFARILGLKEDPENHGKKIFYCTDSDADVGKYMNGIFLDHDFLHKDIPSVNFPGTKLLHYPSNDSYLFIHSLTYLTKKYTYNILMMSALYPVYREIIKEGGILLHAALLFHADIGGIAILARGGTGKTTCAKRIPVPWSSLSDDLMLVVRDRKNKYFAHPLPTWSSCSHSLQRTIEEYISLHSLFFLQRADHDRVISVPVIDAVQWIYDSCMQVYAGFIDYFPIEEQSEYKNLIFSNACDISNKCPSFILKAMYDGYFWVEIERLFLDNGRRIASES
jgi:SynChlorMet cassette protein ScmC